MKTKPQTLQNRIIKETFTKKKRMSKALSVKKKMRSGRTDTQTSKHTDLFINTIGMEYSEKMLQVNLGSPCPQLLQKSGKSTKKILKKQSKV